MQQCGWIKWNVWIKEQMQQCGWITLSVWMKEQMKQRCSDKWRSEPDIRLPTKPSSIQDDQKLGDTASVLITDYLFSY
jgi:hypothetical protein